MRYALYLPALTAMLSCGATTPAAEGPSALRRATAAELASGAAEDAIEGPTLVAGDPGALCDDFTTISLDLVYADPRCAGPAVIAIDHDPSAAAPVDGGGGQASSSIVLNAATHDRATEHLEIDVFTDGGCSARLTWVGPEATLRFAIAAESPTRIVGRGSYARAGAAACAGKVTFTGDWAAW